MKIFRIHLHPYSHREKREFYNNKVFICFYPKYWLYDTHDAVYTYDSLLVRLQLYKIMKRLLQWFPHIVFSGVCTLKNSNRARHSIICFINKLAFLCHIICLLRLYTKTCNVKNFLHASILYFHFFQGMLTCT